MMLNEKDNIAMKGSCFMLSFPQARVYMFKNIHKNTLTHMGHVDTWGMVSCCSFFCTYDPVIEDNLR